MAWISPSRLRKFYSVVRVLHIYFSALFFTLLILFCISGLLLNHTQWMVDNHRDGDIEKELPTDLLVEALSSSQLSQGIPGLEAWLADNFHLSNPAEINIDAEVGEITFDYKLPAGYAFAIVDVNTQQLMLEYRKGGILTIMGDLHKGRNTGAAWSWIIDVSAVVMTLFAITGLILLYQNRRYKKVGFLLLLTGTVTPIAIYLFWVPRLLGV